MALDPAAVLFGSTRRRVLGWLLGHADEAYYLRELVRHAGGAVSAVQRELEQLTAAGGHSDSDYLFWKHDFHAVQEAQRARLKRAIAEAPAESVRPGTVDEVADRFADIGRSRA